MFVHFSLFCFVLAVSFSYAKILIDSEGGYTNVIVGIHPEVPDSKIQSLLTELEVLFKDASRQLQEATKGKFYFKEIIFTLPKKYQTVLKFRHWVKGNEYFRRSDILITSNDVFQRAYTVQNDGCGKPGLRIHIPDEFIFKTGSTKGKDLVRAWAKYRYGIFDESGFVGDDLYPACYTVPGTNSTMVTDCTNKKAAYDLREIDTGYSKECYAIPKFGRNNAVTSSLMSNMDFPNVKLFCDDQVNPHNRDVPSKQNVLCREQSTWKVISQHEDFQLKHRPSVSRNTRFKYVMESDNKLILAVDTSNKMTINDRLDVTRNAFSYFLLYNLPRNSTVGIINLKSIEDITLLVKVETQFDAERLIDAFPEHDEEGNICVHCSIETALENMKNDSEVSYGEIVIATATDVEESSFRNLEQVLAKSFVILHVIYFENKIKKPPLLQKLVDKTNGKFFYIAEDMKPGISLSSLTQLYEAFRVIYESLSWKNTNHVLVDQATFTANDCSVCTMTFGSDESMESFQVLLTGPDFLKGPPVLKSKIILKNENQNFTLGDSSLSYKIKIPAYMFSIKQPQPGIWSVSFQRKKEFRQPVVVIVRGFNSKFNDIVHMKTWIKYDTNANEIMIQQPQITFYAEIKRGNFAVNNASVTATLYNEESGTKIAMPLFDNGDGDPDITKNDGIFSRYFTHAPTAGYYILTIQVEAESYRDEFRSNVEAVKPNYCCGSSYPSTALYDSKQLVRTATYGSIFIYERNIGNSFTPRRINDLRVEKLVYIENSGSCFSLKWTAPGDNYDYETAKDYQMRVFKQKEDAQKNFDSAYVSDLTEWNIHGSILTPHEPGSLEGAIVELKNITTGNYYLAMRTIGYTGKFSEISNVVNIFYTQPTIPPTTYMSTPIDESKTGSPDVDKSSEAISPLVAITIATGILVILIIIGLVILVYTRSRSKKENEDEVAGTQRTESNDALCDDKERVNVSVISPVNSWPANSLLSHYESKRNKKPDVCDIPMVHKEEDSISTTSTKYSYNTKYHENPSFYDSPYFPYRERDDINFPFNPTYETFNPTHTSSLRHFQNGGASNGFSPTTASYFPTFDGRERSGRRLRTDV